MEDSGTSASVAPPGPPGSIAGDAELRRDLHATLAAHQELGPKYESELVDAFLRRLDQQIDQRIDQRLAQQRQPVRASYSPAAALAISLGLTIPLIAIAGGIAGGAGIVAVLVLV